MVRLDRETIHFLQNQGFVIVSTIDKNGIPHNACKGIVKINSRGQIYLLDLYKAKTYENLKENPRLSITAVDEHKFEGFCLKGKARVVPEAGLKNQIVKAWEERITSRITRRVLKNIREEKGHPLHPEALLPKPQYLIIMDIEEIISLTPQHLKSGER